jgi:hypothetical protein
VSTRGKHPPTGKSYVAEPKPASGLSYDGTSAAGATCRTTDATYAGERATGRRATGSKERMPLGEAPGGVTTRTESYKDMLRDVPGGVARKATLAGRYQQGQAAAASAADDPAQDPASSEGGQLAAARVDAQNAAEAELCYYSWRERHYIGQEQADDRVDVAVRARR